MDFLSSTWNLCRPLKSNEDVEILLNWITDMYVNMATFNYPYPSDMYTPLPANPVKMFCDKLTTSYFKDTKGLIEHFSNSLKIYTNYTGRRVCNNISSTLEDFNEAAWDYQTCTELIMPKCSTDSDMFVTRPWDYNKFAEGCAKKFGVKALKPDWAVTAYGGKNLKYFSNIVFSNGAMDPWSLGGVLENISASVWSISINDAPHHLDLRNTDKADNNYVLKARNFHIQAIKKWLNMI